MIADGSRLAVDVSGRLPPHPTDDVSTICTSPRVRLDYEEYERN